MIYGELVEPHGLLRARPPLPGRLRPAQGAHVCDGKPHGRGENGGLGRLQGRQPREREARDA